MSELQRQLNVLSVLHESLTHFGRKKDIHFQARDGSCISVKFEVTDATRAILSVKKGADTGAMTIFKPLGGGEIIKEIKNMWKLSMTPKIFDMVYESGAYLLYVKRSGAGRVPAVLCFSSCST